MIVEDIEVVELLVARYTSSDPKTVTLIICCNSPGVQACDKVIGRCVAVEPDFHAAGGVVDDDLDLHVHPIAFLNKS